MTKQSLSIRRMRCVAAALALGIAAPAFAGGADYGSMSILYATTNAVVFAHNGARSGAPSCATGGWALETTTVAGQSALTMLMIAYALHKRIWIQGTGSCSVWGDRETIDWFAIED